MPASPPASRDGTQAIRRAGAMLRAVAKAGPDGATLADIARGEGLARSTAHRILKCLVDDGFLEQSADGRAYRIGGLIHELGLTSTSSAGEIARWRRVVEAVAARTGVTCYLMRRSGVESVCLAQVDGRGVMRFVPVEVGQRRLLGVGGGATALLAALPPERIEEVIRAIAPQLAPYPRITAAGLRAAVKLVHRTGFAVSQGTVVPDGFGLGLAIPDADGPPRLAISIAAHATTVTESAITGWKKVMTDEVQRALAEHGEQRPR